MNKKGKKGGGRVASIATFRAFRRGGKGRGKGRRAMASCEKNKRRGGKSNTGLAS